MGAKDEKAKQPNTSLAELIPGLDSKLGAVGPSLAERLYMKGASLFAA
jgi:hypothetical protein